MTNLPPPSSPQETPPHNCWDPSHLPSGDKELIGVPFTRETENGTEWGIELKGSSIDALNAEIAREEKWDRRWLNMVKEVLSWSQDRSTKCGCVIVSPDNAVLAVGYNGLPRGIEYTEERHERPEKYYWFEHSERNAIYNAARTGTSLVGATAYVSGPPCHDCARGLCQVGIRRVVIPKYHNFLDKAKDARWGESCNRAQQMMELAGVSYEELDLGVRTDGKDSETDS